jgi:hypothetical protein
MGGKMPARKVIISSDLKHKISPAMLWFTGLQGIFLRIMFIVVAALMLQGGSGRNGFMYLVGSGICPSAVAVLCSFVPLRPYRGMFYQKNVHDVDRSDPVMMRLVELFRSSEARVHIWRQSLKLSGILFVISWGGTQLFEGPVAWSLSFSPFPCWICLVLCFGLCFTLLSGDLVDWGLTTWASREAGRQQA